MVPDGYTCRDRLYVVLKKAKDDYILTAEDFENERITRLQYRQTEPDARRLDEKGYLDNFRQDIYLYFPNVESDEDFLNLYHYIENLDFVKLVGVIKVVYD